jgi:chloramphenicol 3-O phosphotransferase
LGGRLIALVGTSSVGKSSIARRLQELVPEPHLVVGLDHFFDMFPHHWAGHPRGHGPGFWYDETTDADGAPRARIRHGEAGQRLLAGMRAAVMAMLDRGNDIILDEMPLDDSVIPAWRRDLGTRPSYWVRLTAPLDVVEAREATRGRGQHPGNDRGHFDVGVSESYDVVLDTSTVTPERAAEDLAADVLRWHDSLKSRSSR